MPLPTLRSALLASVVGGVLLPAEVSGGMMTVRKSYSGDTADCKAANLKKSEIYEVPGTCTATSDYGGTVKAVKKLCTAGEYSEVYYTDTSCTTTDASRQAKESGVCTGGSNYYEDYTDCVDASTVSHGTYAQYTQAGCAAADKNGDGVFASAACVLKDDFKSDVWVKKSESQVLSSDKKKLTIQSYEGASDCTGTFDGTAKVYECGVCQLSPGSTDTWLVVRAPGCSTSGVASAAPPSTSRLAPLAAAVAAAAAAAVVQRVA